MQRRAGLTAIIVTCAFATGQLGCSRRAVAPSRPSIPINADGSYANPFRIGRPLVIPHAGGDAMFPENTLYAFEHSVALGADVVDIDVRIASDGVPVAMHDSTVDRTTDGRGDVRSMTSLDLAELDAGYRFVTGATFPFRGVGITVPTIESVLQRFPDRLVTLDMKDQRVAAVAPVCRLLRRFGSPARIYVGIDVDEQVVEFRRRCPEVFTSGTSAERAEGRAARDAGDLTYRSNQLVGQPSYRGSDGAARVTIESLATSHRSGTAVLTWIVDDPTDMQVLIDIGVDGIYTRRPDVLLALLGRSRSA